MRAEINKADLTAVKLMLSGIKNGYPKVMTRAFNKTSTSVVTKASQEIRQELNLKAATVKENFTVKKATWTNIESWIKCTGKPIGLYKFIGTRKLASGDISVKVKKTGARVRLRHAFIAKMKSGYIGVFQRRSGRGWTIRGQNKILPVQGAHLPKQYRLPIEELTGPRIEDIYAKPARIKAVLDHAGFTLEKNIESELNYELSKL